MNQLMTVLVAAYEGDLASANIAKKIIAKYCLQETGERSAGRPIYRRDEIRLAYLEVDSVFADDLDQRLKADAIVFASRHKSDSGEPTLTVHVSGNLTSNARFGGRPNRLALADPHMVKSALQSLKSAQKRLRLDRYLVSIEATHHGPTELQVPSLFVEIGSSEEQWNDEVAAEAVADAIYTCATKPALGKPAVGFGGGHYSMKHTEANEGTELAVGHVLPKYFFDSFDPSMVWQAFERTIGECNTAVIDWKGIRGPERRELIRLLRDKKVDVVRV
jgi:D-aminoacyl-tRNA deacylase